MLEWPAIFQKGFELYRSGAEALRQELFGEVVTKQ
jgi:hypothetical protein